MDDREQLLRAPAQRLRLMPMATGTVLADLFLQVYRSLVANGASSENIIENSVQMNRI